MVLSGTTLYGTTSVGGSAGHGTVFKVNTDGTGYTVLHNFTGYPTDGRWPDGRLLLSGTTLYGTTPAGGGYGSPEGYGTLFKLETNGTGYTLLKQFTGSGGFAPGGGFVLVGTTLYGTTEGGYSANGSYSGGTVFKINTDGSGYTVLHDFAGSPSDGAVPSGDLVLSGTTLFGITTQGGGYEYSPPADWGDGTVFMIKLDGSGYSLLKQFTGDDGRAPYGGLLMEGTTLYGTASSGGISNNGVVFSLVLPPLIQNPPPSQTAEAGSAVGFSVKAQGAPVLAYQWFFNGTNKVGVAPTNSILWLTNVQPAQAGAYTVLVTNSFGAVTSAPALLSVIPPVERRWVPGLALTGQPGSALTLETADIVAPAPNWARLDNVASSAASPWCFDLTSPPPPQRFYRTRQMATPGPMPLLNLRMIPALTVTGKVGDSVRVDGINRYGPIDAWFTLDTVTLTNTPQLYFDISAPGKPQRLYRLVLSP